MEERTKKESCQKLNHALSSGLSCAGRHSIEMATGMLLFLNLKILTDQDGMQQLLPWLVHNLANKICFHPSPFLW